MSSPVAHPLYFGSERGLLFGWLHPSPAPGADVGIVICNPFGFEELCVHRSLRWLADAAAQAGWPTMRFDYHGTGDSSGDDESPDRVAAWLASIHAACDAVKRHAGVTRIVLLGLRFGATLAAAAAIDRGDVAGLIAIAPVISGKAYARELRALQMASSSAGSSEGLEAAGFVIAEATRAAMSTLDLSKLSRPPAQRVILLERDDLPADPRWPSRLENQGATVDRLPLVGYADMMADPHRATVPRDSFAALLSHLRGLDPAAPGAFAVVAGFGSVSAAPDHLSLEIDVGGRPVREEPVTIGSQAQLAGILSLPADAGEATAVPSRGGILLLNAGAIRRVGPSRLYVSLARHWAACGFTVLRVDMSGLGDSPTREGQPDNQPYSPLSAADVAAALEFLHAVAGASECRVVGLCSGAYHAFKAAVSGLPLRAVVLINPLTFFWRQGMSLDGDRADYQTVSFGGNVSRSLRDPQRWRRLLRGGFSLPRVGRKSMLWLAGMLYRRACGVAQALGFRVGDHLPSELRRIVRQRVDLQFVFSSGDMGQEVLRAEGGDSVSRLERQNLIGLSVVPDADHLFTSAQARTRLRRVLNQLIGAAPEVAPGRTLPAEAPTIAEVARPR